MAYIRCEHSEHRPGFKAIGIPGIIGNENLVIEERFLAKRDGEYFLPVDVIGRDHEHNTSLIQLPWEADSGANRMWVNTDDLLKSLNEVPA
jgi:hypothetical protein